MYYSITAVLIAGVLGILSKQKCGATLAASIGALLWVYSERHFFLSHGEGIARVDIFLYPTASGYYICLYLCGLILQDSRTRLFDSLAIAKLTD